MRGNRLGNTGARKILARTGREKHRLPQEGPVDWVEGVWEIAQPVVDLLPLEGPTALHPTLSSAGARQPVQPRDRVLGESSGEGPKSRSHCSVCGAFGPTAELTGAHNSLRAIPTATIARTNQAQAVAATAPQMPQWVLHQGIATNRARAPRHPATTSGQWIDLAASICM